MRATFALTLAFAFTVHTLAGSLPDLSNIPGCNQDIEEPIEEVSLLQSGTKLHTTARSHAKATATAKSRTVAAQPEPTHVEMSHAIIGDSARRLRDQQRREPQLSLIGAPYESEDAAGRQRIQQHVADLRPMGRHGFFLAGGVIASTFAMLLVFWIFGAQPMNPEVGPHKGALPRQSLSSGASTPDIDVPETTPQTEAQAQTASAKGDNKFDIGTPPSMSARQAEDPTSTRAANKFEQDMVLAAKLAEKLDEELFAKKQAEDDLVAKGVEEVRAAKQKADQESAAKKFEEERAAKQKADEEVAAKKLQQEMAAKHKAEEELASKKLEEERAASKKADEELVAKKFEEERVAKLKADEELAAKKLEEDRAAKLKTDEELAANKLEEEMAAKEKADEGLATRKLEEQRAATQKADQELAAKKLEDERVAKLKADEELAARKLEEDSAASKEKIEDLENESLANGGDAPDPSPTTADVEEAASAAKKANGRQRGTKKPRQGGGSGKR